MSIRSLWCAVVISAAVALSGCASSATIQQVADKPIIEVKSPEQARPIQFRKVVIKLKRGADIGSIQAGVLCVPHADLVFRGGKMTLEDDELTEVFRDELQTANYQVVGDPDALFEDPSSWKAEYLIAGLVKSMQANVCYPMAGFGDVTNGKGEAFMEVGWQVYSRLDRKVVYELTTQGRGEVTDSRPSAETDIFLNAFAQATRNLLADQGFYDLVAGGGSVLGAVSLAAASADATSTNLSQPVGAGAKLFSDAIQKHMSVVQGNVALVFAGDGHGSGFFIDGAGHLLTNEHVVRTAERVKIRLASGQEFIGRVVATDSRRDVALIEVGDINVAGLPVQRERPELGAEVYAVGSPLDESFSATLSRGIVSAYRVRDNMEYIQSDVSILPGSSGGPLLDQNGNVIGITVSGMFVGDAPTGINFFIPIGDALRVLGVNLTS